MNDSSTCCDVTHLERFLHGELSEQEQSAFSKHLETCDSCQRKLDELIASSQSWDDLARHLSGREFDMSSSSTKCTGEFPLGPSPTDDDDDLDLGFLTPSTKPDSLGRLGQYEILEVVGRGGMGLVFRAFDDKLQRVVAIKVMARHLAATSPPRKRFLREARAAAAIRHERVIAIHAVEEEPIPYLVMEYVPGETLQQTLDRKGPLATPEVLRIGEQIARGLAAAHAQGLIHRDIKPGNILVETGIDFDVKITDFGLARAANDASLTYSGVIVGTPMYMAPEQVHGEAIDHRADLFSLGSVLYTMCSGRPPFRARTSMAVLKRVSESTPRSVREIIPEVPQWLCDIIARLHAKNPEDRFQSAKEVAELLAHCQLQLEKGREICIEQVSRTGEQSVSAKPARSRPDKHSVKQDRPWPDRRRRVALAAAVVLLLVAGMSLAEAAGVTNLTAAVIRIALGEGTLVIEVDDPGVQIALDGEELSITGAGLKELKLRPGQYQFRATKDGQSIEQKLVSVSRGGKEVVRVTRQDSHAIQDRHPASELDQEIGNYRRMIAEKSADPAQTEELASVSLKLGSLLGLHNRKHEAVKVLTEAIQVLEPYCQQHRQSLTERRALIDLYYSLSSHVVSAERLEAQQTALKLSEELVSDFPDSELAVRAEISCLAALATSSDVAPAERSKLLTRALKLAESKNYLTNLPSLLKLRGKQLVGESKFDEAEQVLRRAISISTELLANPQGLTHPDVEWHGLGQIHYYLANSLEGLGQTNAAIESLQTAISIYKKFLEKYPENSVCHGNLGQAMSLLEKLNGDK